MQRQIQEHGVPTDAQTVPRTLHSQRHKDRYKNTAFPQNRQKQEHAVPTGIKTEKNRAFLQIYRQIQEHSMPTDTQTDS